MVESICVYLRNEVFMPVLGKDTDKFTPILYDVTTTGNFHEGGVFTRQGFAGNFAVSDDTSKAVFVTDDPPVPPSTNLNLRLHLLDLASGTQSSIFASERLLASATSRGHPNSMRDG